MEKWKVEERKKMVEDGKKAALMTEEADEMIKKYGIKTRKDIHALYDRGISLGSSLMDLAIRKRLRQLKKSGK